MRSAAGMLHYIARRFRPSLLMTLLTAALCAAFIRLGQWQWDKGVHRQQLWDAFARGADAALPAPTDFGAPPRFQRITLTGRYDGAHQFLLDNRTHGGLAGYEVLTPFALEDGRVLLVDRGWVPFTGYRAKLPDIGLAPGDAGETLITGRLDQLPAPGLAQGRAAPPADASWPKLTSYPDMQQLRVALATVPGAAPAARLPGRILLLDPGARAGYIRDWQPPGLPPLRHFSYAIQWWGFALTAVVLWVIMSFRRGRPT
jgi:surfeit locus 1 family protein